jgi:hypothetical protein
MKGVSFKAGVGTIQFVLPVLGLGLEPELAPPSPGLGAVPAPLVHSSASS